MIEPDVFGFETAALSPLGDGEVRVQVHYVGVEPAMRGWIVDRESYVPPVQLGEVMRAIGVGEVVESRTDQYPVGLLVTGLTGWQEYATVGPGQLLQAVPSGLPETSALSACGLTGLTAYFGLFEIGRPNAGETVLVSGAAGATGCVAGQLAKLTGCRVVGTAGSTEKCGWLTTELGFDAAINYKREDLVTRVAQECPDGIDVFFDNVGGDILEVALDNLRSGARVVMCGGISSYNAIEPDPGPRNLINLVIKSARIEGFIVSNYVAKWPEAATYLAQSLGKGDLKDRVQVVDGLEHAPRALNMLFTGDNTGKLLVRVSPGA
jgi:NADPH-dependent curcumin reductase CurA